MYLSESLSKRKHPKQSGPSVKTSLSQEPATRPSSMMISLSHKEEPRQQQRPESELSTVSVVDLETVATSFTAAAVANTATFLPSNNSIVATASATSNLSPSNSSIQFRPPLPPPPEYAPAAVFQLSLPPPATLQNNTM